MPETTSVTAADGTRLHVETWSPSSTPRFAVVIVHGLAEHGGRYDGMARRLNERGAFVFAPDHRGQGASGGPRGHVDGFTQYTEDLNAVILAVRERHAELAELPLFVFGHSMGGLITLLYLLDHAPDGGTAPAVRGAIVSSPLIRPAVAVPLVKRLAAAVADRIAPRLAVPTGIPSESISRDAEVVRVYDEDPRRARNVTARWNSSMEAAIERAAQEVDKLTLPMLWYVGTADVLCDHEATIEAFGRLRESEANDQTLRVFDGYFHELHNEPEDLRAPILEMIEEWFGARA